MEKLGNKFDGIYKFLKRRIIWGSWIGILMSLVLDILPFPYFFNWIEEIFSFDLGNLLSIALMIWTFVTALLVYYMGRIKDKFFGVNLRDALQFDENQQEFYNEIKNAGILVYSVHANPSARTSCTSLTEDENHPHGDCTILN